MTSAVRVAASIRTKLPATSRPPVAPRWWISALPLVALPAASVAAGPFLPPWAFMSALALAIFFGFKWLTWRDAVADGVCATRWRHASYLFLWPGMDARAFLSADERAAQPQLAAWAAAFAKLALGALLVWGVAPRAVGPHPLLGGWIGLIGLGFLFHFGGFHVLALAFQAAGVRAEPIMRAPLRSRSLAELWGRRWNLAFHDLATRLLFRPLRDRAGAAGATLAVFLASGIVHDVAISLPARGGYGLPTLYFLVQGIGILIERSAGVWSRGARGRLFALVVAVGPVFFLFHPHFIVRVVLPLLRVMGAAKGA